MKFESKFGIGEVVISGTPDSPERSIKDNFYKVTAVTFGMDGEIVIHARHPEGGYIVAFSESELIGDPDFDQEKGYPEKETDE